MHAFLARLLYALYLLSLLPARYTVGSRNDFGENRAGGSSHHEDSKDRNGKENTGASVQASSTGRVARKKSIKISNVHSASTQSKQSSTQVLTSQTDLDNMISFVLNKVGILA